MNQASIIPRILIVSIIISILQGCNFMKIRTQSLELKTPVEVFANKTTQKYAYVVHLANNMWKLNNLQITKDVISGDLTELVPGYTSIYKRVYVEKKYRYRGHERYYVNQVHIYLDEMKKSENQITFNSSDISKIDVIDLNIAKSVAVATGITAAGFGAFLAVACNCPHTYTFDGENYHYNNTLFTGATSMNMERNDYKDLPDYNPKSDEYSLIIKNEDNEHQFTNLMQLMVVNHESNIEISKDQNGTVYGLKNKIKPISVLDDSGNDLLPIIAQNDNQGHLFDNTGESDYKNVFVTFDRPKDITNAKLVLKTKNSGWAAFVYKEFSALLGDYHENWVKKNHKRSKEEVMTNLKKAGIPMVVSVKYDNKWIDIETINLIGEVNYNTLVVPIDASLLKGEQIEVRISTGFMFWDLDYINIDFTPKMELDIQYISPTSAQGTNSTNDRAALTNDDDIYMQHLKTGDSTTVIFKELTPAINSSRTILLHSKGYYLPQDTYEGKLQRKELVKIKGDGGMSKYSEKLYKEVMLNYAFEK